MIQKLKNLIRIAIVTVSGDDSGKIPLQQFSSHGKATIGSSWYPFGFHAIADEDSYTLVVTPNANGDEAVHIPTSMTRRPTGGAKGEVYVYHPKSGSYIHMKDNGDIEIKAQNNMSITAPNNIDIEANGINLTSNTTTLDSNFIATSAGASAVFQGPTYVIGSAILGATVTSNSVDISNTHTHGGVQTGSGNTDVPN